MHSRKDVIKLLAEKRPSIAPSMLKCDFANLHTEIKQLEQSKVDVLHWDVMDGHFVPNLSYGAMVIKSTRPVTKLIFDAHLMISDPGKYLDDFLDAGCEMITFHIEAMQGEETIPNALELIRKIKEADRVAGIALNPQTPLESIMPLVAELDLLLVMSVQPGFGGQKFIPDVLSKIRNLSPKANSELIISIDGGIGTTTIRESSVAGANFFVCGSSIFDTADYTNAVDSLISHAKSD